MPDPTLPPPPDTDESGTTSPGIIAGVAVHGFQSVTSAIGGQSHSLVLLPGHGVLKLPTGLISTIVDRALRDRTVAVSKWMTSVSGGTLAVPCVISERIVRHDPDVPLTIQKWEVLARSTEAGRERITRDIPDVAEEALRDLDETGIVMIGTEVLPGDILVGKVTPRDRTPVTPEEKLLRAIFGQSNSDVRDTSFRLPPGGAGTVHDIQRYTRSTSDSSGPIETVIIFVARYDHVGSEAADPGLGRSRPLAAEVPDSSDGTAVLSAYPILPAANMPRLPDGSIVDLIINPNLFREEIRKSANSPREILDQLRILGSRIRISSQDMLEYENKLLYNGALKEEFALKSLSVTWPSEFGYFDVLEPCIADESTKEFHDGVDIEGDERLALLDQFAAENPGKPVSGFARGLFVELRQSKAAPALPNSAPALWKDRPSGSTPVSFIKQHYAPWIGKGLTRPDIRHFDPPLYQALATWVKRHGPLDFELPTRSEVTDRWIERVNADPMAADHIREARRLASAVHRRKSGRTTT